MRKWTRLSRGAQAAELAPLPDYLPGAGPYFHRGGDVGVLCLHGLTASPAEVRWFGEHLAGEGFTVYAARAAGHGTDYRDLQRTRWQDWYLSALDGYHILRQQCRRVFIAGLSMGGMLGLLLAAAVPVDGLVIMAAPVQFRGGLMRPVIAMRKHLRPFAHMPDESAFPRRLRQTQLERGEPNHGRVRYDTWALQAVTEIYALAEALQPRLPQVTAPALLIYSEQDKTVPLTNLDALAKRIGSAHVERHILKHSGHIMTQDSERETVFQRAAEFITRQAE